MEPKRAIVGPAIIYNCDRPFTFQIVEDSALASIEKEICNQGTNVLNAFIERSHNLQDWFPYIPIRVEGDYEYYRLRFVK